MIKLSLPAVRAVLLRSSSRGARQSSSHSMTITWTTVMTKSCGSTTRTSPRSCKWEATSTLMMVWSPSQSKKLVSARTSGLARLVCWLVEVKSFFVLCVLRQWLLGVSHWEWRRSGQQKGSQPAWSCCGPACCVWEGHEGPAVWRGAGGRHGLCLLHP